MTPPVARRATHTLVTACLLLLTAPLAAADSARGAMVVTLSVLPSCEVRVGASSSFGVAISGNEGPVAEVHCAAAYPFRASLGDGTARDAVVSGRDTRPAFNGVPQFDVSRLNGTPPRGIEDGVETLTISY